ncbi:MAG: hypothetical protein H0T51_06690 [Pirellulales bacterium]|nr:hypothetical protein [Pirellulales bacterium]
MRKICWKCRRDRAWAFALLLAYGVLAYLCAPAHSAQCRAVQQIGYVAPTIKAATFAYHTASAGYYEVGGAVAHQAQQLQALQSHPDWDEFRLFQAFKAGAQITGKTGDVPAEPEIEKKWKRNGNETEMKRKDGTETENRYAAAVPAIVAKCARCHTGDEPGGGIWLDGSVDLRSPEAAEKRDAIMAALVNGRMPKKSPALSPEEFGAIVAELWTD